MEEGNRQYLWYFVQQLGDGYESFSLPLMLKENVVDKSDAVNHPLCQNKSYNQPQ